MNLNFTLATTDKKGETLPNPGVEYIQWSSKHILSTVKLL